MRKFLTVFATALVALILMTGCDTAPRNELYRVYQGQNGDWMLEVRLWVVYEGLPLLPADIEYDDSGTYTRTYWKLEYHGDMSEDELCVAKIEVGDGGTDESWLQSLARGDGPWLGFNTDNGWMNDHSYTNGIEVGNAETCYAVLTDTDGGTVRIDAPLIRAQG